MGLKVGMSNVGVDHEVFKPLQNDQQPLLSLVVIQSGSLS